MKTSEKQTMKVVDKPTKHIVGASRRHVANSRSKTTKMKFKSKVDVGVTEAGLAQALHPHLLDSDKPVTETVNTVPKNYPEQTFHPSVKVKLQLFPVDEDTRLGLEKDGYHPYLELTLSSRKRISSVLKHLNSKWGGSRIAVGEPILLPYSASGDTANYLWTLNENDVRAGDVFVAVGCPPVFRLRYGWFSHAETNSSEAPSISAPSKAYQHSEDMQENTETDRGNMHTEGEEIEAPKASRPFIENGTTDVAVVGNGSAESMGTEVRTNVGVEQSSAPWDDGLTNISIGGLLSEASMQGKVNNVNPKRDGNDAGLQPSQLVSDSLDAFITAQISGFQSTTPPPHGSGLSILDAENTCHAFSFQKFPSTAKGVTSGEVVYSQICGQDSYKSFKISDQTEVNTQSGLPQGYALKDSESDLSLCSRVYSDERSLGLSGIKWTDSLGPFDLGLSSS
ncbi:hypothetical protein K2173_014663 [Erythroxylum novogranatense]|uniref:TSL-kinase interacting protein 1 n=1 Tax=Erythroxylum novogranatense TaxID=1862640 RepID=A0AAV8TGK1_9ROSI|nr:hypothetical protein K2173_014663 [Erythroxylum novogranatense]